MMSLKIFFFFLYYVKQIHSMLPWICSLIDHRGCQNGSCAAFLFLSHFDVTCDLLLNSHMATLNPSVTVHSQKPGPLRQWWPIRCENWNNRFQHFQIQLIKGPVQNNEIATGSLWCLHDLSATYKLSSSIVCLWV